MCAQSDGESWWIFDQHQTEEAAAAWGERSKDGVSIRRNNQFLVDNIASNYE